MSNDAARIATRKAAISEQEWRRCLELGNDYLRRWAGGARNGAPSESFKPALIEQRNN